MALPRVPYIFLLISTGIEIWGRGINKIRTEFERAGMDVPEFEETEGGLMVSFKRKYLTNQENGVEITTPQVTPQVTLQVTPQVQSLLSVIKSGEMSVKELMKALSLKDRHNFLDSYLNPAIAAELVVPVFPDQPRHPRQKYRRK